MNRRHVGSLAVSVVGLGCNNFGRRLDAAATADVVHAALDAGINFFDTATIYGGEGRSETFLGEALRGRRHQAIIASKFGHRVEGEAHPGGPEYVHRALDASLRRLQVDCIDLYQLHEPDPTVPVAETLGALHEAVAAGKIREAGCSNFTAEQLVDAAQAGIVRGTRFVSVQNEFSLFHMQPLSDGVLRACEQQQIAFLPYFPLANGLLTGKYRKDRPIPAGTRLSQGPKGELLTPEHLDRVERLLDAAERHGHTLLELAFAWLLAHKPVASVIAGATSAAQVQANARAADWIVTRDVLAAIPDGSAATAA